MLNKLLNWLLKWQGVPQEHELIDSIPKEKLEVFEQEARLMKNLSFFKWYVEDLELLAERKMFAGDEKLQLFGKGILYCLEMMKTNVVKMSEGKIRVDSPEKKKMTRFIK